MRNSTAMQPTREFVGEWVKCPSCGKKFIHAFDSLSARPLGGCICGRAMVEIIQGILNDGKVSIIDEVQLP